MKRISASKLQSSITDLEKRACEASYVKHLKPQVISEMPLVAILLVSQVNTFPRLSRHNGWWAVILAPCIFREPMTILYPESKQGRKRSISEGGVDRSASQKCWILPLAASMPTFTAWPLP